MTIPAAKTSAELAREVVVALRNRLKALVSAPIDADPSSLFLPQLLARAGVDRLFTEQWCDPPPPHLPPGASEYLSASNPRLAELRRQYALLGGAVTEHSVWSPAYVQADLPLQRFRGDCALMWQQRDLNLPTAYVLTYYYLRAMGHKRLLDSLCEDDLFGIYTVECDGALISRDKLDSASEIAFLDRTLGISKAASYCILDIGSGYGRLAHRLAQAFDNVSIICVDAVAESTFLCEYYVRFRGVGSRVEVVPLPDIERVLAKRRVDAAVNVHAFSECPLASIRWWVDLLTRAGIPNLMVVPNAEWHGGLGLLSAERDRSRRDFRPLLEQSFRLAAMEPKYADPALQRLGITPTHHFLFRR